MDHIQYTVQQEIEALYQEARKVLLSKDGYSPYKRVDITNTYLYLSFLEAAMKKPFNRITHLNAFVKDTDQLMVYSMYPFTFLAPSTIEKVGELYLQAVELTKSLAMRKRERRRFFGQEPHEM